MLPIPLAPSDVTPAWLTAALRQGGPSESGLDSVDVTSVTTSHVQSLTSTMHRLHIEYAHEVPQYPPTLIWKQSSIDPAIRAAFGHFRGSGYEREVRFYREVAPRIATRVPRCYLAQYDEATDEHVLLLEDLAPTHRAGDLLHGMRVEDAAAALRELALLHCADWGVGQVVAPATFEAAHAFFLECLAEARPFLAEVAGADTVVVLDAFADMLIPWGVRLNERPPTLLHADTHPANMMFPTGGGDDRVALVDWQGWRSGPAMRDVGRCLVLMLSAEDRRRAERDLVAGYCEVLRVNGVEYPEATAFADYRIGAANQWIWAVTFVRRREVWDDATREAMPGLIRRAAAAALDLLATP